MSGLPPETAGGRVAENPRLRWLLRRGLKELDVLFERYHERHYGDAGRGERDAFARLLEREDPEIQQWVMNQAAIPPEFQHVIAQLRRHD